MAESTQYLIFRINLTDPAVVETLHGTGDAQGAILAAPDAAAVTYSAPKLAAHATFVAPSITSAWFDTAANFPTNVASFDRKSGGWFGWSWLFGNTTHYKWRGLFVFSPPPAVPGVPVDTPVAISPRRWIDGFEYPSFGEGGSAGANLVARIASRHVQGFGFALRSSVDVRTHATIENVGGASPNTSWERFYVRLRRVPDATTQFWRSNSNFSAAVGLRLSITPSGQIAVDSMDSLSVPTLLGTSSALPVDTWVRLDLLIAFGQTVIDPPKPTIRLYQNGVSILNITSLTAPCSANGVLHVSSTIGTPSANTLALDIDDWMNADYVTPEANLLGVDFQNGSAMVAVRATGFDASMAGWTGDWQTVLQNPAVGAETTLTSAAGAARLTVTTDAADSVDALPGGLGIVALVVVLNATVTAGSTLGYKIGAAAEVLTASLLASAGWYTAFWRLVGAVVAQKPNVPLLLTHVSGAAGAVTVTALAAVAEVIGVFGPEDLPAGAPALVAAPPHFGPHNAPYPRTPWATLTSPPIQPVMVVAGTYVGTGTVLDLAFTTPIHFLWIRPVTGNLGGTKWWSSLLGPHKIGLQSPIANLMVQASIDGSFVAGVGPTPSSGTRTDLVRSVKAALVAAGVSLVGDCGAFAITKRVAWNMRAEGVGLKSASGTNCDGYATDILMWPNGDIVDILINAGTDNTPAWNPGAPIDPALFRAAVDPGDEAGGTDTAQQQTRLSLVGANTQNNALGVTYAYLAIGDPGMRFMLNTGLTDWKGTPDRLTTLEHPSFTPLAGFIWPEVIGITATATLHYKGPGHASASISLLGALELANRVAFGLASVTSQSAFHTSYALYAQTSVSLWRTDDGSGQAGKVVQILSYAGDGVNPRVIALTPASGKRPLWALVVPHSATPPIMRDPAHTGTTSQNVTTGAADAATGITAGGIDTITVSSALNTAGIVYDVFVIPGGTDECGNGGWSCPGTFYPVPPEPPPGAPGPPVPPPVPGPPTFPGPPTDPPLDPLPPTGPMPGLVDDLDPACEPDTRRILNVALSRLGISKQILVVATEQSAPAVAARLHYKDAIEATLRDHAWPFATRYVRLIPVSDTTIAINSDWLYSYRQPNDCLFERRLVVTRSNSVDPAPPPFELSSDATGGLIFTNEPNAVLEYTARPACPHTRSEPLWRDAVAWKFAALMAPALTRMPDHVERCTKMYLATLEQARLVLKPGKPGPKPATATVDVAVAAQAANVQTVNVALIRIGARPIRNLSTDQSREAIAARLVFETELRACLRDFPWNFATVYVTPVLVAGTATVPVNGDWLYSYRLPTDLVLARRLVTQARRAFDAAPPTFKTAQDATGGLLYTDEADAVLEYTNRPEAAVQKSDALFQDAFAWRLASSLAPSLAQVMPEGFESVGRGPQDPLDPKKRPEAGVQLRGRAAAAAWQMYQWALGKAKTQQANEGQPDITPTDADWITGRD